MVRVVRASVVVMASDMVWHKYGEFDEGNNALYIQYIMPMYCISLKYEELINI